MVKEQKQIQGLEKAEEEQLVWVRKVKRFGKTIKRQKKEKEKNFD